MDTKLLTDFFGEIPSASQIAKAEESINCKLAEMESKIEELQRQNDEFSKILDEYKKVFQEHTALFGGLAKAIDEKFNSLEEIVRENNDRIGGVIDSIGQLNLRQAESAVVEKPMLSVQPVVETKPKHTAEIKPEPVAETKPEPIVKDEPKPIVEFVVKPEPVADDEPKQEQQPVQTLADSIHVEESLADRLSKKVEHKTVASALNASHIDSIRGAITIADRFRFQRELFAGNGALMNNTIDELDKLATLDDAEAYIDQNFQWNADDKNVQDFRALLVRRY